MKPRSHQRRSICWCAASVAARGWWAASVAARCSSAASVAALVGALCALLVWTAAMPRAWASESREFSSQEAAQLRAGKLVVRAEQRTIGGARLLGGMSWQVIDASPAEVWRTINDVRTYAHFLPAIDEALLIETHDATRSMFIRHRVGFISASYWIRAVYDPARYRVHFRLDHDHPAAIRDAWGEVQVTPYANQKCVVSFAIMSDLGEGLFVGLVRSKVHEWMLRVPDQLKRFVDSQRNPRHSLKLAPPR